MKQTKPRGVRIAQLFSAMRLATPAQAERPHPQAPVGLEARQYQAEASVGIIARIANAARIGKTLRIIAPVVDALGVSAAPNIAILRSPDKQGRRKASRIAQGRS